MRVKWCETGGNGHMAFENVELFDRIAADALAKYGWQERDESKLIVLSENATYMVKNRESGEKDGVLRISRRGITR